MIPILVAATLVALAMLASATLLGWRLLDRLAEIRDECETVSLDGVEYGSITEAAAAASTMHPAGTVIAVHHSHCSLDAIGGSCDCEPYELTVRDKVQA